MATNLVTRAEYKTYVGITSTTSDAEIDLLITNISALVKTYCRQTFVDYVDDAKVEFFNGGDFDRYYLKEYPIIGISGVEYSTDYGASYTSMTQYTEWVYDPSITAVRCLWTTGFKNAINGFKVTYTCGYESVPVDLKMAVMDLITYYRKNDSAVHTHKLANPNTTQVEYIASSNFPAHIKRILDLYTADFT